MKLIRRFFNVADRSMLLLGAPGTGKSTWVRHRFPDSIHLDMESPSLRRKLLAHPERLRRLVADAPGVQGVVVDEFQNAPQLLPLLQRILEEQAIRRLILTASHTRFLRRGDDGRLASSLPIHTLHPLLAGEFRGFDLDHALRFGTLPDSVTASDPAVVLHEYRQGCLAEVTALGLTRHLGRFSRFLGAISSSHTQRLNVARVARESEAERKVVAGYVAILEDMLLAFRVPVFQVKPTSRSAEPAAGPKRATVARDKLFLFDTGFFRSLLPGGGTGETAEVERRALAGLVVQQIRAWAAYSSGDARLYYWRTRAGTEVDVVLHGSSGTAGLKIMDSDAVSTRELRELRAFRRDYPHAETAVLYRGHNRTLDDGTACIPVADFLRALRPGESLPVRL